jgi:hypothetical protein
LEKKLDYSILYTSRGCIRKCGFCMVPKLEPDYKNIKDWEKFYIPGTKKLYFYDNNFLAKDIQDIKKDINKIKKFVFQYNIKEVDFNQGLDARLMNEEKADLLAEIPIIPIRFAYDGKHEEGYYQKAIEMMIKRNKYSFRNYMLYNFLDKPQDYYYRVKETARLAEKYKKGIETFPMKYQPITDLNINRNYIGKYWSKQELNGIQAIVSTASTTGILSFVGGFLSPIEEMEYWFGENEKKFMKLINYKNIRKLCKRKMTKLRILRTNTKN